MCFSFFCTRFNQNNAFQRKKKFEIIVRDIEFELVGKVKFIYKIFSRTHGLFARWQHLNVNNYTR